ncbi:tautomerase family protein [Parafrankia sp. BMG5.11]|uniref:tautomerase family protein n=1 Tax=Parafrankia sp. BMG5.11 TaxID=222540 RepID=UPI00103F9624|nr:tautomerase family protein [Parafrankia sp. BMG5.11]TCJ34555.1 hypothetical protein E0504_31575 [Parafrankia sp. BMG5.11]
MPEVHVFMAEGRTGAQKRGMMQAITTAVVENLDCPPDVVTVQIIEAKWTEKMKSGKTFAERYVDRTPQSYKEVFPKLVIVDFKADNRPVRSEPAPSPAVEESGQPGQNVPTSDEPGVFPRSVQRFGNLHPSPV